MPEDVHWSDGGPLTADDVVFTYRLIYNPAYRVVRSRYRGNLEEYLEGDTSRNGQAVVVRSRCVYATLVATLAACPSLCWVSWPRRR